MPETLFMDNGPQFASTEFATLLAYRATPFAQGVSPAQFLMGRQIRTTSPTVPEKLVSKWPDLRNFTKKDAHLKSQQKCRFDTRHRAKILLVLDSGQKVWIRTAQTTGIVEGPSQTPRSYVVKTDQGSYHHNRSHLIAIPETTSPKTKTPQEKHVLVQYQEGKTVTHCGKVSYPPIRLNL